jgi:DNA-binding PadR family transcriptional regulator
LAELNTTGYALLGLLNQHPRSAYELTQFMRVSHLRAVWPRAESRLYEGPKKLVKLGYATASSEQQGKRPRTVYTITDEGRQALRDWLKTDGKDVIFEHEALLQLSNTDAGDIEDLHRIIERLHVSTDAALQETEAGMNILAQRNQQLSSDKRFVISTLVNHFLYETVLARKRWLAFADAFTAGWTDLEPSEEKLEASRAHYRELAEQLRQHTDN